MRPWHELYDLTSVSVLINISDVADCHTKHGVIGPVEPDGPSLIVPVAKGVQVDIHCSTDLCLTVKEIWSSNNQIGPTWNRQRNKYISIKPLNLIYT